MGTVFEYGYNKNSQAIGDLEEKTTYSATDLGTVSIDNIDSFITSHGFNTGAFDDVYIGSYFTASYDSTTITFRIAGLNWYCGHEDSILCNTPHAVIVPDQILTSASMNSSDTNSGAYSGSKMVSSTIPTVITNLTNIFGDHLLSFNEIVSSNGTTGTTTITTKAILMNELEVFGTKPYSDVSKGGPDGIVGKQLPLFSSDSTKKKAYDTSGTAQWWWERDCYSSDSGGFCSVYSTTGGSATYGGAYYSGGVRPRFLIG